MDWSQFISLTSKDVDLSALEAPKDGEDVVIKEGGLKEFLEILVNKDYLNNKTQEGKDINSNFKTSLIKQEEDELNISNNDITRTNAIESSR